MNTDRLLASLDRVTPTPEAIPRLRNFILDLAVRGKLVPQDPNDEPASELLKRIAAENTRLGKASEPRGRQPKSTVEDAAVSMTPPVGWAATRLGTISYRIHYGFTASANAARKDIRMLRITDIQENAVDWPSVPGCVIGADEIDQYKLEEGDILVARTGGTVGKTFLVRNVPVTAVFASYLIRIQAPGCLSREYLKLFMESPLYWAQLREGTRGTGQPNVNGQTLGRLIFPLPPLAEQRRIVAKVDELMTLCDGLEASLISVVDLRRCLLEALLARVLAPVEEIQAP